MGDGASGPAGKAGDHSGGNGSAAQKSKHRKILFHSENPLFLKNRAYAASAHARFSLIIASNLLFFSRN